MFNKKIILPILLSSAVTIPSVVTSCEISGYYIDETKSNNAEKLMKKTEFMSKLLIVGRTENLNVGTSSLSQDLYYLNSSSYDNQLGTELSNLESLNSDFNESNIMNASTKISETGTPALISAATGDNDYNNSFSNEITDRKLNIDTSSTWSYQTDTGPLKLMLLSNNFLKSGKDIYSTVNGGYYRAYFSRSWTRDDELSNMAKGTGWLDTNNTQWINKSDLSGGVCYLKDPDNSENQLSSQTNEFSIYNTNDYLSQILSLNEISKSKSLVNNKNNLSNLWTFVSKMFNINSNSEISYKIFGNISGMLFSKLYLGVSTNIINLFSLKDLIFSQLFNDSSQSYYDNDFVKQRTKITDNMYSWIKSFKSDVGDDVYKSFINARYSNSSIFLFDNQYDGVSMNDLLYQLKSLYSNFFDSIEGDDNSTSTEENDLNNKLYDVLNSKIGTIESLASDWAPFFKKILTDLKCDENPNGAISAKTFIMGFLNLFTMANGNNEIFKSVFSSGKISELQSIDTTTSSGKNKLYKAIAGSTGSVEDGSILSDVYNAFNDKTNDSYILMNELFVGDNSIIKGVVNDKLSTVENSSINALFGQTTNGIDVNWSFSNPVYSDSDDTITYDVTYTGPGDSSVDYSTHEDPLVTKKEIKENCELYLKRNNGDGIWDYLINKLSTNSDTYTQKWFYGYSGLGSEYSQTTNSYKITIKNYSQNPLKEKYGLYKIEWYHDGKQLYDIFE